MSGENDVESEKASVPEYRSVGERQSVASTPRRRLDHLHLCIMQHLPLTDGDICRMTVQHVRDEVAKVSVGVEVGVGDD